jgi:hypothetical protein
MSGVVPVNPKKQFFTTAGAPLVGGFVDVYLAGTTTRSNTWEDRDQLTLNTNPIELNARGECDMFVDPDLTYKFVLKDPAGATLYTVDNVPGAGNQAGFTAALAAAVADATAEAQGYADDAASSLVDIAAQVNAASAAAKIYASTAAGLAAVASGEYFYVPSTDSGETLILYLDNAGDAVEVKRIQNGPLTVATRAAFTGTPGTIGRMIQITADEQHGNRPTINYWDGKTLRFVAEDEPTPASVLSTSNNGGIYALQMGSMYQDVYAQTPVTASGDTCSMVLDVRGKDLGSNLISVGSFSALAGVVYDAGAGTITCTAATGDIAINAITTIGDKYWADFAMTRSAGTVNPKIGLNTTVNLSTSGTKSVYINNTSGTNFAFTLAGFTGVIYSPKLRKDSRPHLIKNGVFGVPTLTIDSAGVPYLSGGTLVSAYSATTTLPLYLAAALSRVALASVVMCNVYGSAGDGANITNQNAHELIVGGQVGGVSTTVQSRQGSAPVSLPTVVDVQVKAGSTVSWVYGGHRDVTNYNGAGYTRTTANSYTGAETITAAFFHTNYNNGSTHRFHGAVWWFGEPTTAQRTDINQWLRRQCGLGRLDEGAYDIFLLAGQSNMQGVGDYTTSTTPTIGTAAEFLDNGGLKPLKDPVQHAAYGGTSNVSLTGSMAPAFAASYYSQTGRRVCVVGGAFSGVGLLHDGSGPVGGWQSTGPLVAQLARKANACLAHMASLGVTGRIMGVLWQGGEQDVLASFTVASYKTALVSLRDRFRTATGVYNLPLYIISLDRSSDAPSEILYTLIRQAQSEAASENDGIDMAVTYQDYLTAGNSDGIHLNQTAHNANGVLAATAIAAALN